MRSSHQERDRTEPIYGKDIEEYHMAYNIDFDETDIDTFISGRPDGLAFDKGKTSCVFLEYTRAMDTNEDWAEKEKQEIPKDTACT